MSFLGKPSKKRLREQGYQDIYTSAVIDVVTDRWMHPYGQSVKQLRAAKSWARFSYGAVYHNGLWYLPTHVWEVATILASYEAAEALRQMTSEDSDYYVPVKSDRALLALSYAKDAERLTREVLRDAMRRVFQDGPSVLQAMKTLHHLGGAVAIAAFLRPPPDVVAVGSAE